MANFKINDGVVIDLTNDGWAEFKKWLDGTYARLRYTWVDEGLAYNIITIDGKIYRTCSINKSDAQEFETSYKKEVSTAVASIDGTPISLPCLFPAGVFLYICGAGDDLVNGRGAGQEFQASKDAAGDEVVEWQFNDLVYMAGGGASFLGAELGDWASLEVLAPATVVTPNGGNTGNCNLVDPGVGAAILIVPAAGNGAYDVDLSTAVPVPAQTADGYNGYWEWDYAMLGRGTITPGSPGTSHFHLLAIEQKLVRYANKLHLLGGGDLDMTLPAVEPKAQLPHWKGRLTLHNHVGHAGLQVCWFLHTARVLTL